MGALMLSDEVQSGLEGFERDKSFLSRLDGGCVLDIKKGLVPNMRVPGRVYVSSDLANQLEQELDHYHRSDTKYV